jgi:hypothetical protein
MNDLEALEVRSLLASHSETFLESAQPWGASWSGLEPHIQASLASFRQQHPGAEILGIELQGSNAFAATNIDHHYYPGDDRTSPRSSLEQVAVRLDVELNRWQKLVAANDRSYIPAMLATGASPEEVARIRAADRAAQGLTPRDEDLAVSDIQQRAEWRGPKVLVSCLERPTSAHSDRLFGLAAEMLLTSSGNWSYSGPRHKLLAALDLPEEHWAGGDPASGYFGIRSPSPHSRHRIVEFFWA